MTTLDELQRLRQQSEADAIALGTRMHLDLARLDDLDPAAFDRWLVPGFTVAKLGRGWNNDMGDCWLVYVLRDRDSQSVLRIADYSGPVTALTLLHALHDRGMLRPEAYESPS